VTDRSVDAPPSLPIVLSEEHRAHDPAYELNSGEAVSPVYERPERLDAIAAAVRGAGWPTTAPLPQDVSRLRAVHDPDMIAFLQDGYDAWRRDGGPEVMIPDTFRSPRWAGGGRPSASPRAQAGWWCFDTATPIVMGSYRAARAAVDVALTAADLVADGAPVAYGMTRPPGHHAGYDYFGGFCFFNHAAAAARRLTEGGRVAVLDIDVHHGNGTQDLFWRDPDVLYVSLHGDPHHEYPYFSGFADEVGEGPGRGRTRNLPLRPDTSDDDYLLALTTALEAVDAFDPASVVVSVGFDTSEHDPIGSLAVTLDGLSAIGRRIGQLDRPTLLLQEGGYAVDHLGDMATTLLHGVLSTQAPMEGRSEA
jgi:acetoin utilization deacetylase AcuC-like enzyme